MNNLSVDILAFLRTATILTFLGVIFAIWRGIRSIQTSQDLPYFRLRRERLLNGWRLFGAAVLLLILGLFLGVYGEPVALRYIDVTTTASLSPTTTLVPSGTISPTITLSPSITPTLEFTYTPTITSTPHVPLAVEVQFTSVVTPNPDAVFSELTFSQGLDSLFRPLRPGVEFPNPVGHHYDLFSYDNMIDGVQWTALWYREGELVFFETQPWDGGTGGLGFTNWEPVPEQWMPGNYQVQIFVGLEAKAVGDFVVTGVPVTRTPTPSLTPAATISPTITLSPTPFPTLTRTVSPTPYPTQTRTPVTPSITPQPTQTRTVTPTPWPTATQ